MKIKPLIGKWCQKRIKNPLLRYRIYSFFSFSKKILSSNNFWLIGLFIFYLFYWAVFITMGLRLTSNFFVKVLHLNIYQVMILLFLLISSMFSSGHIMIIKKQIKNKFALSLLAIGIKKDQIFYDRFIPNFWKIIIYTFPIIVFGFLIGENKLFVLLIFVALYILVFLIYSFRLLLINVFTDFYDARYIELLISLIIYTISFVFLPIETAAKNKFWIKYFQYLSPVGWLLLSVDQLNNFWSLPYIYLYLPLIPLSAWTFLKAKTTTLL